MHSESVLHFDPSQAESRDERRKKEALSYLPNPISSQAVMSACRADKKVTKSENLLSSGDSIFYLS